MEILLRITAPEGRQSQALLGWLSESPEPSGKARLTRSDAVDGAHGRGADAVAVALGSGGSLTALALCLKTWSEAYYAQRRTGVHVEITGVNGKKAVIDASNVNDAEALLRQLIS